MTDAIAPILDVTGLRKSFGGLRAVDDVTLAVPKGSLTALIGPNGAGKTTLFALVSGFIEPDAGTVAFGGRQIAGMPAHQVCRLGMTRTFQIVQPFAGQTVLENIAVGAHLHRVRQTDAQEHARAVAARVGLGDQLDKRADSLPIAGRKRLELARALATDPKLLLLDEVMAGLNPSEIAEIIPIIRGIRDGGVTILLIEHVMQAVVNLAEHVWVLSYGKLIAEGSPAAITTNPQVIEAYLGHGAAARMQAMQPTREAP
jgi:branched-chain amino acid transport system ATP-binding protein